VNWQLAIVNAGAEIPALTIANSPFTIDNG